MSNSITLPWPPASLSGHANGLWREKSKVTKKFRNLAIGYALKAGWNRLYLPDGDIQFLVTFTPPDNRADRVNYPNRIKPYIDGIADAAGVNDKRFCIPKFAVAEANKANPGVKFEIIDVDVGVVL